MPEPTAENMTPEVKIAPPVRETSIPEVNKVESFKKWFHRFGKSTHDSTVKAGNEAATNPQERPLLALVKRAEFLKEYRNREGKKNESKETWRENRQTAVEQGKAWDELTQQYLNQGEITVDIPGLGVQSARYTRLDPPESRKTPESDGKPRILLIPGISNDLDSVGGLLLQIPFQGRPADCVAFPESFMGSVTPEYAEAVEKANDFGPHVEFYKSVIDNLYPNGEDVELWGFSNGAAIVEQILHDTKFQARVPNAVLISPAASADMSSRQLIFGTIKEMARYVPKLGKISQYSLTQGRKTPEPEGQRELKKRIFGNLMGKVRTNFELWKDSRVKDGGKIIVVSGERDNMTHSRNANESFLENPQVTLVDIKKGSHMTPLLEADKIVNAVNTAQAKSTPRKITV